MTTWGEVIGGIVFDTAQFVNREGQACVPLSTRPPAEDPQDSQEATTYGYEPGRRCKVGNEGFTGAAAPFPSECPPSIVDFASCSVTIVAEFCRERDAGSMWHRRSLRSTHSLKPSKPCIPSRERVPASQVGVTSQDREFELFEQRITHYCSVVGVAVSCRERDAGPLRHRWLLRSGHRPQYQATNAGKHSVPHSAHEAWHSPGYHTRPTPHNGSRRSSTASDWKVIQVAGSPLDGSSNPRAQVVLEPT